MSDDEKLIAAFEDNLDTFRYPGPVVCELLNTPQTEMHDWRRRGYIPADGFEKRGRIQYKGVQVLRAGIIAELGPFVGPARASEIADECLIARPFDWRALAGKALIYDPRLASEAVAEWAGGSPLGVALVDEAETFGTLNRAKVVLPLGHLVRLWMVGAEMRMQAVEA
jgi:hypothetical protein